jgi:hypothetical protein
MFVAFIYCLWLFALGNIVMESFSEDFQDQAFEESQLFFADQPASYLEHVAPMSIPSILYS